MPSGTSSASTTSVWDAATGILRTELKGSVTEQQVARWRAGLHREVARIPDHGAFRLLLDLVGFEAADMAAHKAMRTVVPGLLARHGMRPAFLDLFEEKSAVPITVERGVRCLAFANVHHDEEKMRRYEERIAKPDQRFFTDVEMAEQWLLAGHPTSSSTK